MKKCMMMMSFLFSFQVMAADLNLSPSSLKLKVFKMAVSTSPLCTDLVTVVDNGDSAEEVEFVGGVSLGSGSLSDGTYECVVIEFGSYIRFTPAENSDSGNCLTSTEETLDVCQGGTSVLTDGTTTTCAVSSNDRVAMYLSTTSSASSGSDGFNAPTEVNDSSNGFNLGSSLTVAGATSGTFVVNPAGQVCDDAASGCDGGSGGGTECLMGPPAFSFE